MENHDAESPPYVSKVPELLEKSQKNYKEVFYEDFGFLKDAEKQSNPDFSKSKLNLKDKNPKKNIISTMEFLDMKFKSDILPKPIKIDFSAVNRQKIIKP
jgi:hypothetical protein